MTIPRALLAFPLLVLPGGCTLASLPYRATQAVVDPAHANRAKADQRLGHDVREAERRARRAYEICRRDGGAYC